MSGCAEWPEPPPELLPSDPAAEVRRPLCFFCDPPRDPRFDAAEADEDDPRALAPLERPLADAPREEPPELPPDLLRDPLDPPARARDPPAALRPPPELLAPRDFEPPLDAPPRPLVFPPLDFRSAIEILPKLLVLPSSSQRGKHAANAVTNVG